MGSTASPRIISADCHICEPPHVFERVPAEFREAAGFAVLGGLCQDRVPITLAQVTHRAWVAGVSGAWVFP